MGTVRVILSCSAIFSLTIMDGFGAPLGSWRKERKRKSRVARRRANKKNHFRLHSSFPPSFGRRWRRRGVLLLPLPALALARSPSLPPRPIHRRRAVAVAVAIALPPRPPDGQFVRTTILIQIRSCAAKERGRQTDRGKGASPSFLAGSLLFTLWGFLCHCQAELLL